MTQSILQKELANYTTRAQTFCMNKCEDNVADEEEMLLGLKESDKNDGLNAQKAVSQAKQEGVPDGYLNQHMNEVSIESLEAIEKQCNKMCIRKMMKAYSHIHNVTRPNESKDNEANY